MDFEAESVMPVLIGSDEDSFERGAALDDVNICVRSQQFRGGSVTAVMSGVTVDLREAGLSPEGATIHVQSALSGIEILVPHDWVVACDVGAVWGGVESSRFQPRAEERRPRLRVTGMVVAGGISVR